MRRLVLFDIDGTLVRGGPAKEAFHAALLAVFGTAGRIHGHEFSGKTDPQIARELLRGAGMTDARIDEGFPALWDLYLAELQRSLPLRPVVLLPAVRELLDGLERLGEVALGLVTGNIARGAALKLASVGLDDRFPVGGYGSDHEERNSLPGIALARARDAFDAAFGPDDTVIVGDTPRDVACGRGEGMKTVAVATGNFGVRALEAAGAERVVEDFSDTEGVLEVLLT